MKETLNRLRKNKEFKRVYKFGNKVVAKYTVLFYIQNDLGYNRAGFSISKKVGNSVRRHRIKRLYFESLRRLNPNLKRGYDLVIVARKSAMRMDYHSGKKELESMLKRAHLWAYEGDKKAK